MNQSLLPIFAIPLTMLVNQVAWAEKPIRAQAGRTVKTKGWLQQGKNIDLRWASTSNMACWPATQNEQFNGKHFLYTTQLPPRSELTIELLPASNVDLSLYAYTVGKTNKPRLPPAITTAVSCEASALFGNRSRSKKSNPGGKERVQVVAANNPYTVVIGVVGANKTASGTFTLNLTLKSAAAGVADTGPPPVKMLKAKPNGTAQVRGSLASGKRIPLPWASGSQMACWPATQNNYFDGKHVLYKTKLPPNSEMTITLEPGRNVDLSLYAYTGVKPKLPPKVSSAVACEASHLFGIKKRSITKNPGQKEQVALRAIKNPYDVIIGVAGARKTDRGSFSLKVALKTKGAGVADTGPPPVQALTVKPNGNLSVRGSINKGKLLPLAWASTSQMACWPATQNTHYNGKHVAFTTKIPPQSAMTIELVPGSRKLDLALYAYSVGAAGKPRLPPNIPSAVSCEASHLFGVKKISKKTNPGGTEKVELRALRNPYNVVIGVAGSNKTERGSFELKVRLKTAGPGVADTGPPPTKTLNAKPNKKVSVRGSINGGKRLPLAWAASSQMACWPATQNAHFDGNHVLYLTKIPPRSRMTVELMPSKKDDLSLYAYTVGASGKPRLPPKVPSAVSCEASALFGIKKRSVTKNPGGREQVELAAVNNPYNVVIGVAGARKATKGSFELRVKLETAGPGVKDTGPPPVLKTIVVKAKKTVQVSGNINKGKRIPLRWASKSSVACWPATQNEHYNGNHVLYQTKIDRQQTLTVELSPKKKNLDLSLYAYTIGSARLPPNVPSVVSCEASALYGIKKRSITSNPGGTEKLSLTATTNPYNVVIGVVGARGATSGNFKLKLTAKPR